MPDLSRLFGPDLLASTFRLSTPILIAALGGVLSMRAGVFNIAMEGMMLIGAFFAIAFAEFWHSAGIGLGVAVLAAGATSLVFSLATIKYKGNQIVAGIAINLFGEGLTTFLLRPWFHVAGAYRPTDLEPLPSWSIPYLHDMPVLGPAFSGQSIIVYLGFILVLVTFVIMYWTPFGLQVRIVGEHPEAARSAGVSPEFVQFIANLWCGLLCGLAGAYLSLVSVGEFSERMTQGRGFTAFTAVVFGRNDPIFTFLASLLFGFADALGFRIQLEAFGLPPTLLQMFPYVLAIVVLVAASAVSLRRHQSPLRGLG